MRRRTKERLIAFRGMLLGAYFTVLVFDFTGTIDPPFGVMPVAGIAMIWLIVSLEKLRLEPGMTVAEFVKQSLHRKSTMFSLAALGFLVLHFVSEIEVLGAPVFLQAGLVGLAVISLFVATSAADNEDPERFY